MSPTVRMLAIALGLAVTAGCGSPPTSDIDAARAAHDRATASAARYAPESLKAARDARTALDAEVRAQEARWFKSYDRTRELAVAAKAAAEKAEADAAAGKTKAEAAAAARAKAKAAATARAAVEPVRVGGRIRTPTKVKDVPPVYPEVARSARVQGRVLIEAIVGPTGKVEEAKVIRSIPLLDQAALDAVRQWEYAPTVVRGVPTPVVITVAINFTRP
jgi:TonB family protein